MGYEEVQIPKGTSFLVTGAAGFIGSNLVERLLELGMFVRALDNFSTGKRENIDRFIHHEHFDFVEGDIRNYDDCLSACQSIQYVLHQAALGSIPRSIEYPLLYEENNIQGTLNMMEAARASGSVRRVVFASSSSVFGDSTTLPKVEGGEGRLLSPYSITKAVNEHYGTVYSRTYGLECIGLRYFNVFGRYQDPYSQYAAVIPIFLRKLLSGESPIIYGDGEQSRDFTYIENVIEANLKACVASKEACGEVFNIACGERYSINQIFNQLCRMLNTKCDPIYIQERKGDMKHSLADISKARRLLDYDPSWNFHRGIDATLGWYLDYLRRES